MPASFARCASSSPTRRALAVLSPSAVRMAGSRVDAAASVRPTLSSTICANMCRADRLTTSRGRLVVNRSARHMFAQIVDDSVGRTLAAASTLDPAIRTAEGDKTAKARRVGELLAQRAKEAGIEAVVLDRGGYSYHGRIAALADGAREGGLKL